ncbi:MAG: hypothetical protein HC923_00775 [Myxococcales bacterium]|nr:hypothetical protein [Myxococcales bacterium]
MLRSREASGEQRRHRLVRDRRQVLFQDLVEHFEDLHEVLGWDPPRDIRATAPRDLVLPHGRCVGERGPKCRQVALDLLSPDLEAPLAEPPADDWVPMDEPLRSARRETGARDFEESSRERGSVHAHSFPEKASDGSSNKKLKVVRLP